MAKFAYTQNKKKF